MKGLIGTTTLLLVGPISRRHRAKLITISQGYSFATRPANLSTPAATVMPPPEAVNATKTFATKRWRLILSQPLPDAMLGFRFRSSLRYSRNLP